MFDAACEQCKIPISSRIDLMINVLGIDLDDYLDKIKGRIHDVHGACESLGKPLRLCTFMSPSTVILEVYHVSTDTRGFTMLRIEIIRYLAAKNRNIGPMCGPNYRVYSHHSRRLAHMLREETWGQS